MSEIVVGVDLPGCAGFRDGPDRVDGSFLRETLPSGVLKPDEPYDSGPYGRNPAVEHHKSPKEPAHRFYDALRPSLEIREKARAIVRREAEVRRNGELAQFTDADIRGALGYIEGQLFDPYGAPLPTDIAAMPQAWHVLAPPVIFQADHGKSAAAALYQATFAPGANRRIAELYGAYLYTRDAEVSASEYILQHPLYQTLATFVDASRSACTEQPLTQYEKDVAAAAVAARVRQKYGMRAGESYIEEQGTLQEITRGIWALDDATMPEPSVDVAPDNPFKKAQAYLESLIPSGSQFTFASLEDRHIRGLVAGCVLEESAGLQNDTKHPRHKILDGVLRDYTKTVIYTIYRSTADGADASQENFTRLLDPACIANAVQGCLRSSYLSNRSSLTFSDRYANYQTCAQASLDFPEHVPRRQVASVVMSVAEAEDSASMVCSTETAGFVPYATVLETRLPVGAPRGMRMLASSAVSFHALPKPSAGTSRDLVIEWGDKTYLTPFTVAGFTPVAKDGNKIYFAYTPENDPNAPARISLPADKLQNLIGQYEAAGLGVLAKKLQANMPRTVEELRHGLKKYSTYIPDGNEPKDVTAGTIAELADAYATNGQMHYQCTGAAQMLKLSLQQLFGVESARPLSGQVFDQSSEHIGPIGHAQVLFSHEGSHYYLDATPAQSDIRNANMSMLRPLIRSLSSFVLRQFATAQPVAERPVVPIPPKVPSFIPKAEAAPVAPEVPVFTKEQADAEIIALRNKRVLPVVFGYLGVPHADANREKLYKEIMRLSEGDPSRRVLEMTHRVPAGNMTSDEVSRLRRYIQDIQNNGPDDTIFQFIDYQSPAQLKVLEGIVSEAEAILAKVTQ